MSRRPKPACSRWRCEKGIGIIVKSPLDEGALTGKNHARHRPSPRAASRTGTSAAIASRRCTSTPRRWNFLVHDGVDDAA